MDRKQKEDLERGLTQLGLAGDNGKGSRNGSDIQTLLTRYIGEIELWNPSYKLVAAGEDLVGRHILDSLSGLDGISALSPRRLADVGSGAGFPGIPLAICLPGTEIHLIEKMGRRAGFLRTTAVTLGLDNVTVLEKPVERVAAEEAGFDVVTFRAWSALDDRVLDSLESILADGGRVAAYKGRRDVIDSELAAVSSRISNPDIQSLKTFSGDERNLIIFSLER